MTLKKKKDSYIWPTWITGLLSGEDQCEWAPWLKANYTYDKVEDGGGDALSRWMKKHDELLKQRVSELKADGWTVRVEGQNSFTIKGQTTTIGGKPDIIARRGSEALISDPKGGKRRHKYVWQVRMYMALSPLQDPSLRDAEIRGEVVYPDGIEVVTLEPGDEQRIYAQIRATGTGPEPQVTPSWVECRYCPIANCTDRVETKAPAAEAGGRC